MDQEYVPELNAYCGTADILELVVSPEIRGRGVAKLLVDTFVQAFGDDLRVVSLSDSSGGFWEHYIQSHPDIKWVTSSLSRLDFAKRKRSKYHGSLVNNTFADATAEAPVTMSLQMTGDEIKNHPSARYLVLNGYAGDRYRHLVRASVSGQMDSFCKREWDSVAGGAGDIEDTGDNGRVFLKFDAPAGMTEVDLGGNLETGYVVESLTDELGLFPEGTRVGDFLDSGTVGEIIRLQAEEEIGGRLGELDGEFVGSFYGSVQSSAGHGYKGIKDGQPINLPRDYWRYECYDDVEIPPYTVFVDGKVAGVFDTRDEAGAFYRSSVDDARYDLEWRDGNGVFLGSKTVDYPSGAGGYGGDEDDEDDEDGGGMWTRVRSSAVVQSAARHNTEEYAYYYVGDNKTNEVFISRALTNMGGFSRDKYLALEYGISLDEAHRRFSITCVWGDSVGYDQLPPRFRGKKWKRTGLKEWKNVDLREWDRVVPVSEGAGEEPDQLELFSAAHPGDAIYLRLQSTDGSSNKFINREYAGGPTFTATCGKWGTAGRVTEYPVYKWDFYYRKKIGEGYTDVTGGGPVNEVELPAKAASRPVIRFVPKPKSDNEPEQLDLFSAWMGGWTGVS
jgi:predicted GNAT family acetyltransferase